jgi:hypothetical protein
MGMARCCTALTRCTLYAQLCNHRIVQHTAWLTNSSSKRGWIPWSNLMTTQHTQFNAAGSETATRGGSYHMQLLKLLNRKLQCNGGVITLPGSPTAATSEAGSHDQT